MKNPATVVRFPKPVSGNAWNREGGTAQTKHTHHSVTTRSPCGNEPPTFLWCTIQVLCVQHPSVVCLPVSISLFFCQCLCLCPRRLFSFAVVSSDALPVLSFCGAFFLSPSPLLPSDAGGPGEAWLLFDQAVEASLLAKVLLLPGTRVCEVSGAKNQQQFSWSAMQRDVFVARR